VTAAADLSIAILAGGLATRLGPLVARTPKAMLDIGGQPFIAHQLRLLRAAGLRRVVICASHLSDVLQDYVGDGKKFDLEVRFSFDGPRLLGTGGAIRQALDLLTPEFFVLYGDSYLPCPYQEIAESFLSSGKSGLMTVFHNQGRFEISNVEFKDGQVVAYDKKNQTPRMEHTDYGLSLFRRATFEEYPAESPFDLYTVFQNLIERGQLAAYEVRERFYEIGSIKGLEETRQFILSRQTGKF
jgi:NDP-sugar pyrophosphorylase family protein